MDLYHFMTGLKIFLGFMVGLIGLIVGLFGCLWVHNTNVCGVGAIMMVASIVYFVCFLELEGLS